MKKILFALLLSSLFGLTIFAQTSKLPKDIANWNGKNSEKMLENPLIKARLKKLLGKKNYADFLESFETVNPIVKRKNFLFSSGCLIHACGHLESAIAIDLVNNTIHVGIFREIKATKYFSENKSKTPAIIRVWNKKLDDK